MIGFTALIILAACLSSSYSKGNRYCSICQDHTMCRFEGIGKDCTNAGGSGVSPEESREIVNVHNSYRRTVASGRETRGAGGPQPKAANLRKFVWDSELAKVAQRWADQCRFEHDSCRNDPRWKVGQNLYWKWKYPNHNPNWTEAITSWYDEVSQYNPRGVGQYRFDSSTGHYTQMLWHSTYTIGCGRRDYGNNKLYVCNYGPSGNWIGQPMYTIGEPCSRCPQGTVCQDGLCAVQTKKSDILYETETAAKIGDESESKYEEDLIPPNENAEDVYASDGGNANPYESTSQDQPIAVNDDQFRNDVLLEVEKEQKTRGNSIDENEIDLDADTKKGIEEIKLRIEELLKNVIKKLKTKH